MAKKGYIGVKNFKQRELPSSYTQIEYIQSTGTQYIDTGFKPNNNTRVVMDFQFSSAPTAHSTIFGARDSSSANFFMVLYNITNSFFRSYYNNTYSQTWPIDSTTRYTIDKNKETTTLGGTTLSYSAAEFQCNYNMYLFTSNTGGSSTYPSSDLRVYSCQIYDDGTLIRDYVPCLNADGTAGLYDMVNSVFCTNAGTGSFVVGATYKGVARKISKMYIGVDGVAHKVKKAYIGDENGIARKWFPGDIAVGTLAVGSSVFMNVNGVRTEFLVVHQGLPSSAYDSSCDGIWLLAKNIYESRVADSWRNVWSSVNQPDIHNYLNDTFVTMFDSGIQSIIKQVKIPYTEGSFGSFTVKNGSDGASAKVFLLSYTEVGFSGSTVANVEGAVLEYFKNAADSKRIAYFNTTATEWWLRTQNTGSYEAFYTVNSDGTEYGAKNTYSRGVRPALILPSDVMIDENLNVIS